MPDWSKCSDCGSPRAADQRYCLSCGARLGALTGAVGEQLDLIRARAAAKPADRPAPETAALESQGWPFARSSWMPSPRAAAAAVVAMLALGVAIGSATSQLAQSAGLTTILLEPSPKPPPPEEEPEEVEQEEPEEVEEVETAPEQVLIPEEAPEVFEEGGGEEEPELPELPPEEEFVEEGLPPVKHVFVVMLGENGYEETFGKTSTSIYFSEELPAEGELLPNYYAVAGSDLANQLALVSGQGPTPETVLDCPTYADVAPATVSTTAPEQVEGNGCVYPAATKTLAGELVQKKLKWKAYVEDMAKGAEAGQPTSCRHPAIGTSDPSHEPVPGDAYETYRNPFVYFHSIIDGEECASADVDLEQLTTDLKLTGKQFPALAYIVPNACHKGGEAPCEPGAALTGPGAAEETLKRIIPEIVASPAYAEGGLILVTSSLARQTGATPDASSCCGTPTYVNVPEPPPAEILAGGARTTGGGGRVGLLLISKFVKPGTVNEEYFYNHFSLLRTIEEFFELEPIGYAAEPGILPFEERVFNYIEYKEPEYAPLGRRARPLSRAVSAARSAVPGPTR